MAIILPDLPYAYDALEPYIDAETMTLHHDKHHATYVANANAALEKHPEIGEDLEALLADVEQIPADIRQALINNGGGHLNHALFWELLSPEKQEPTAEVAAAINEAFGSFDAFHLAFLQTSRQDVLFQQETQDNFQGASTLSHPDTIFYACLYFCSFFMTYALCYIPVVSYKLWKER